MNTSSSPVAAGATRQPVPATASRSAASSAAASRPVTCSAEPNAATCSTPGSAAQALGHGAEVGAGHLPGRQPCSAMISSRRALRHQPAVGDVGQLVAALGLVHVMRADEHRDAARRQRVQLFPELAARAGVDAGGRLVEQQQFGLVQHARGERQPLLPAARQRAGELRRAAAEPEAVDRPSTAARRSGMPYMRAMNSRFSRIVRSSQNEKRCVM